ncbi:hypothetical protein PV327_006890 [Microctonus hyperodae]|uniref:Protein stoned-B n=1 Tax=Microctonus hyperodae TaxID=165561 RepID=A0AA39KJ16_MICHY|nr:hypothetical protein PV327_006890 [Microctonus hyperodae]
MDSKGGNPFLSNDYPEEPPAGIQSNPFLQDFPEIATQSSAENPFFNFSDDATYQPPPIDSTNPFAFFEPSQDTQLYNIPTTMTGDIISDINASDVTQHTGQPPEPTEIHEAADLFGADPIDINPAVNIEVIPQNLAANETDIFNPPEKSDKLISTTNGKPTPRRPPPPARPQPPPPPRNTKDLILSVTGAMDATSNHLLDRLQATRTPSPTLMHSPSPTPEHSFADFLDVDSNVPDLIADDNQTTNELPKTQNILDLFDAPAPEINTAAIFSSVGGNDNIPQLLSTENLNEETENIHDNPFGEIAKESDVEKVIPTGSINEKEIDITSSPEFTTSIKTPTATDDSTPISIIGNDQSIPPQHHMSPGFDFTNIPSSNVEEQLVTAVNSNLFSIDDTTDSSIIVTSSNEYSSASTGIFSSEPLFMNAAINETSQEISSNSINNIFSTSDMINDFSQPTNYESELVSTSPAAFEFSESEINKPNDNFSLPSQTTESTADAFDAFASKFDRISEPESAPPVNNDPFFDAFGSSGQTAMDTSSDIWGDSSAAGSDGVATGFGESDGFDSFLSMTAPPPLQETTRMKKSDSADSDEAPDFSVFIKPKEGSGNDGSEMGHVPVLAPPPKSPQNSAFNDSSPRFNPFDKSTVSAAEAIIPSSEMPHSYPEMTRTDSQETPPTPLFDDDVSQPLEDFPRVTYTGDGWEMQLRQPNKKKITGQRFWKKIFVHLVYQADAPVLQLFNNKGDKDPFQELPLLASYSVSEIGAQQFDQYGKIFTVKLQYIFYKERPGVRPGQVTKAERLTNKLSQFAAYAIQGDYQGVKEFGSDLKKLGLPVEHAPQISQLFKLGSQNYEDMKTFSSAIEESLFHLSAHRDRALTYKMEEVQISVVDEIYVEQNFEGHVEKQIARVRLFFLGFLSGMPDVELGINDMWRQGKEVVGRHDIIPVVTEEWIRLENVEFHSCVQQDEYEKSRIIKFKPPDACYIELMRFRVRPPKNRELPLQLKAVMCVTGNKVELRADILVPGFASRKLGQIPCEDVVVRFPIPECWIYLFRVEKHFRYGSVKSAHRRTGKIKGIERFLGAVDTLEPQLMEVTSGQAKYEHQHRSIVWRMPRLPKEGQGAYTTHGLVCRMALTSYDQIPENLAEYCYVEFTMPATQVSHTTARSVSLQNSDSDNPPEKYVRNLSRHEYRVGIEHTQGEGPGAYVIATKKIPESTPETHEEPAAHDVPAPPADTDSDSSE